MRPSHFSSAFFFNFINALIFAGILVYNFSVDELSELCRYVVVRIPLSLPVFAVCLCSLWTNDTNKPT